MERQPAEESISRSRFYLVTKLWRKKIAWMGLMVFVAILISAAFAPFIAPNDPYEQHPRNSLQPPTAEYPMGTDNIGRCVLSRIIYGTRVSVLIGFSVVTLRAAIGIPLGLISGYYGGAVDSVIMRVTDTFIAFPGILLAIAIMAIWGQGITNVIVALTIVGWTGFARLVRGEVLGLKEQEFVEAGRAIGLRDVRIMVKYLLPNILPIIVVYGTLLMATPIVAEAALSFLGVGTGPPLISWGRMLSEGRRYIRLAPWLATFPGLAITVTVLGVNLFGDGLRDVLDPRQKD